MERTAKIELLLVARSNNWIRMTRDELKRFSAVFIAAD